MATKAPEISWRVRVTNPLGNTMYIVRTVKGRVTCVSSNETPLALSYVTNKDPAAFRFALEDEKEGGNAVKIVREAYADPNGKVELL